jgi:hypothetical protein
MYGPKCHNEHIDPSLDVRLEYDRGTPFLLAVPQFLFSLFESYFSKNMINIRFSTDLENPDQLYYSKTLFDLGDQF